ncbi:MAG: D-alanyl-D-alanine carboxypeptidase [Clostridiales bacterium]|nr:D-alanyl-D-alanine carboxypeptidase [Clostridiales bacterium]
MRKIRTVLLLFTLVFIFITNAAGFDQIDINAGAALLADAERGDILYAKNIDKKIYPASITKLMTALLTIEHSDLDDKVVVSKTALEGLDIYSSTAGLRSGEEMTVDQLLICLLVASANDAANVLAEHVAGSIPAFVEMMNSRAREIGMENTHYTNAHGLHDDEHYTTAYDIFLIAREVRKQERLAEIYGMQKAELPATNRSDERLFFSTNSLISPYRERTYLYSRAKGIKTGTTSQAGNCLVAEAEKGDKKLISVVMNAKTDEATRKKLHFTETARLFEWGFDSFKNQTLLNSNQPVCEVNVKLAKKRDYVVAVSGEELSALVPEDFDKSKLVTETAVLEQVEAPVKKGDVLGSVTLKYDEREFKTVDLIAADDVERSVLLYYTNRAKKLFSAPVLKIVLFVLLAAIVLFIVFTLAVNRRRRKRRRVIKSRVYRGKRK